MIKKLFLGLFLLFSLSGCSMNSGKQTELVFSTWGSASELATVKTIIRDFELENPDIKIKLQHIPQNYFKKLHLQLASSSEPDVMLINNQVIPTYSEYLLSLNTVKTQDFYKNAIKALSYDNELKAIPRDVSTLMIYYNKELVSPQTGWSLEDLLKDGARLKAEKKFAIVLEPDLFYLYPFLMSFGEAPQTNTTENLFEQKGTKFFKSLSSDYHYAPLQYELGMAMPLEFFLKSKSAYYLSGRWMYPKISEMAKFSFGTIEFPNGSIGNTVPCDASGWAVSNRSLHKEEALRFINYLASKKSLEKMSKNGLIIPARASVAKSVENGNIFLKLAENSKVIEYPKQYDKYRDEINQLLKIESRKP